MATKTRRPPAPKSTPSMFGVQRYEMRYIRPAGNGPDAKAELYWLNCGDAYTIDSMPRKANAKGKEVTLFCLKLGTNGTQSVEWQLVSFRAYVRPADCGAECYCAMEWQDGGW